MKIGSNKILNRANGFLICCLVLSIVSLCLSLRILHYGGGNNVIYYLFTGDTSIHVLFYLIKAFLNFAEMIDFSPKNSFFHSVFVYFSSFTLALYQILSLALCYFILPKNKKSYIFFPIFGFLTGPFMTLSIIDTSAPAVFSLLWLQFYIIKYADFSRVSHWIILIFTTLDLPASFEHEMVLYMAWPLIILCISRLKKEKIIINKCLIYSVMMWLGFSALYTAYYVFFGPQTESEMEYYRNFAQIISNLNFYLKTNHSGAIDWIHIPCILSTSLLIFPFLSLMRYMRKAASALFALIIIGCSLILLFNSYRDFDGFFHLLQGAEARVFIYFSLPVGILIWRLFERNILNFKKQRLFLPLCLLTALSFTFWNVSLDYRFYQYRSQFLQKISKCNGVLDWSQIKEPSFHPSSVNVFHEEWQLTSLSLLFPLQYNIKVVLKNSDQGFDFYKKSFPKTKYFDLSQVIRNSSDSGCDSS